MVIPGHGPTQSSQAFLPPLSPCLEVNMTSLDPFLSFGASWCCFGLRPLGPRTEGSLHSMLM